MCKCTKFVICPDSAQNVKSQQFISTQFYVCYYYLNLKLEEMVF